MNPKEEKEFNKIKRDILKELNIKEEELTHNPNTFDYSQSCYNGYTYGATQEEWLRMVLPIYANIN